MYSKHSGNWTNLIHERFTKQMNKNILYLAFWLCVFPVKPLAQSVITFSGNGKSINIGSDILVLEDKDLLLTIDNLLKYPELQQGFKKSGQNMPNFSITSSAIWCKITVQNTTNDALYLKLNNPRLDTIQFYLLTDSNTYATHETGMMLPFERREFETPAYLFALNVPKNEIRTCYLRIRSNSPIQIPLKLGTLKAFWAESHWTDLIQGIYIGFILVVIIYNLYVGATTRTPLFFYYAVFAFLSGVNNIDHKGYAIDILWRNIFWINNFQATTAAVMGILAALLTIALLNTRNNTPRLHKGLLALMVCGSATIVLNVLGYYLLSGTFIQLVIFFGAIYIIVLSLILFGKGLKRARFFLLGWLVYLVAVILYVLRDFAFIPYNIFTANLLQIGSVMQLVLFMLALADRLSDYKKEKEQAQREKDNIQQQALKAYQENERLIKEQNQMLEHAVNERTQKLQQTLDELTQANEQLRLSRREYKLLADNTEDIISVYDLSGKLTYISPSVSQMGYSNNELPSVDAIHPDDRQTILEDFRGITEGKPGHTIQYRIKDRYGKYQWFETISNPIYNNKGELASVMATSRNVTARKEAEEELRKQKDFLNNLIENLPVGVFVTDLTRQEQIIIWNHAAEVFLQIARTKVIGKTIPEVFKNQRSKSIFAATPELQGKDHAHTQIVNIYSNALYIRIIKVILYDKEGVPQLLLGIMENVTDEKKSETIINRQRLFYESILNNIPLEIRVFDQTKKPIFINANAKNDTTVIRQVAPGNDTPDTETNPDAATQPDTTAEQIGINKAIALGKQVQLEEYLKDEKDKLKILSVVYLPFYRAKTSENTPELSMIISYAVDITELKNRETQLQTYSKELERSNKDLQQFAYIASHDLKSPLRTMVSFIQLLEARFGKQLDLTAKEYINFIIEAGKRMDALIDDLLLYSRIDRNLGPAAPVNLNEIMQIVVADLKSLINEKKASIAYDNLPELPQAHTSLIVHVLENLVKNGIKFNKSARPMVSVSASETGTEIVVAVTDNGIGIAPEYKAQIFTMFKRLHSQHEYEGTGIGLAICKKIIDFYGGKIWLESTPGKGSTFFFNLPKNYQNNTMQPL